ncbi:alpha/beta hydrolase [Plebeiibacterium marinum]|uniref:Alpha/beta hydrolase n=1 Tax=Plebeiibacterium marinum TaxID=2992111 RepID=A0AAE3MG13_9BACT|nr:alpha/beta hydrolase [Plebeiobacterium marinum]MCW3807041.1 alpha/beta hydrolase [Plebeiobacterium marinum]
MKNISFLLLLVFLASVSFSQQVIPLYSGEKPDGSELFRDQEKELTNRTGDVIGVINVSMPTLTVFQPEPDKQNGVAVIVCPGGGFRTLSMDGEGIEVAQWLASKGVTAFVLKYRLTPESAGTKKDMLLGLMKKKFAEIDSVNAPYVPYAITDGKEAIRYVRNHATIYNIDTTKIGIMGFSAGGTLSAIVALSYDSKSRPDFVAPIYAYCSPISDYTIKKDAPPMFLAFATDDFIAEGNTILYEHWKKAGKSVEMHSFFQGGHGFSLRKRGMASDIWSELFLNWLANIGLTQ